MFEVVEDAGLQFVGQLEVIVAIAQGTVERDTSDIYQPSPLFIRVFRVRPAIAAVFWAITH